MVWDGLVEVHKWGSIGCGVWAVLHQVLGSSCCISSKSRYPEDVMENDHTAVWGSWYSCEEERWGFGCCKLLVRSEPCPAAPEPEEQPKGAKEGRKARRREEVQQGGTSTSQGEAGAGEAASSSTPVIDPESLLDTRMLEAAAKRRRVKSFQELKELNKKSEAKESDYLEELLQDPSWDLRSEAFWKKSIFGALSCGLSEIGWQEVFVVCTYLLIYYVYLLIFFEVLKGTAKKNCLDWSETPGACFELVNVSLQGWEIENCSISDYRKACSVEHGSKCSGSLQNPEVACLDVCNFASRDSHLATLQWTHLSSLLLESHTNVCAAAQVGAWKPPFAPKAGQLKSKHFWWVSSGWDMWRPCQFFKRFASVDGTPWGVMNAFWGESHGNMVLPVFISPLAAFAFQQRGNPERSRAAYKYPENPNSFVQTTSYLKYLAGQPAR